MTTKELLRLISKLQPAHGWVPGQLALVTKDEAKFLLELIDKNTKGMREKLPQS